MRHSAQCIAAQKAQMDRISEWDRLWPDACKVCNSCGQFRYREARPYGSTVAHEEFADPCEACTGRGVCARCGKPGLTCEDRGDTSTGDGPCKFCGWDYVEGGRPEPLECWGECVEFSEWRP
jgi:hypothetical protein